MRQAARRGAAGFTLLEVLVALAVLGLVGSALVVTQQLAAGGTRRADARARALSTAASLIVERSAGARADGRGTLPPDLSFAILSRERPDLVRRGATIVPVERQVTVVVRGGGAARLGAIDWVERGRR